MLPVVVEAAVRATVVLLVVLLALKALRVRNPHILMAAWQMVLAASLLMPFLVVWAGFSMAPPRLVIPDIVTPELAGLAAVVAAPGPPSALSEMAPPVIAVERSVLASQKSRNASAAAALAFSFCCASSRSVKMSTCIAPYCSIISSEMILRSGSTSRW